MEYEATTTSRSRRSFILCLIAPLFAWVIMVAVHSKPGLVSFLGNTTPWTDLAASHINAINGSLYSPVKLFEKAISLFSSGFDNITVIKTGKILGVLMMVFPVFLLTTLITLALATFLTGKAVWLVALINIGIVIFTVIPVIIAQAYYNDPQFNMPIAMVYALSMFYQLVVSVIIALIGSFLMKGWFRPEHDY